MHRRSLSRRALRDRLAAYGVDVTVQAIGCWLRAETSPRPEHQAALAAALGVPAHTLFPIDPATPRRVPLRRTGDR
jgi:transcriptional regulator with XRE-family HTH domain